MNKTIGFLLFVAVLIALAAAVSFTLVRKSSSVQPDAPIGSSNEDVGIRSPVGKQVYHVEVEGAPREFIVYRPENVARTEELPVVFMFHGGGGNGEDAYRSTGWAQEANREGFMAVFPTALKYHVFSEEKVKNGKVLENYSEYDTRWSTSSLAQTLDPAYPDQVTHDDALFVDAMLDLLHEKYAMDDEHVYAAGFSNGGGMTKKLILERSEVFAAYAQSSTGGLTREEVETTDLTALGFTPRPVIQLVGSEDPKLTFSSDVTSFPTDESAAAEDSPLRERYIDGTAALLGLTTEYEYDNSNGVSRFVFDQPDPAAEVHADEYQFLVVEGMEHIFPNGKNNRVNGADLYWSFFERYSL